MKMKIIKRNGSEVNFDADKIKAAVSKAKYAGDHQMSLRYVI